MSEIKWPKSYDRLSWMRYAARYYGIREIKGRLHEPRVVQMFALSGFSGIKDDETAWCAAFVGACLKLGGFEPSGSLAARSYEAWGIPVDMPIFGCVGVKKRSGKNAPAWQGHVGFVVGLNERQVILIGGNQNNAVSIAAFKRSEFTAFRWPSGLALPAPPLPLPKSSFIAASAASEG